MYARFDRLAAELSSSEGSDDEAGAVHRRDESVLAAPVPPKPAAESGAFQSVKAHCMALLGATDADSRDAALTGIAVVFGQLERDAAAGLVKFALLPLMMLLREADAQPAPGAPTIPGARANMALRKERGIELSLAAISAVVKAGGVAGDEVPPVPRCLAHRVSTQHAVVVRAFLC